MQEKEQTFCSSLGGGCQIWGGMCYQLGCPQLELLDTGHTADMVGEAW